MKSFILPLILLAAVVVIPLTWAQKGTTFKLEVKSYSHSISYYQTKAEWQLMKGDKTCRGFYLPRAKSKWNCANDGEQSLCHREYECVLSNKNFNRKVEINRLAKQLKKMSPKTKVASAVVKTERQLKIDRASSKPKLQTVENSIKKKAPIKVVERKITPSKSQKYLEEFQEFSEKEDLKQMDDIKAESRYVLEQNKSLDGRTTVFKIRPKEELEVLDEYRQSFLPLSFTGAIAKVTDKEANTLSTTDIAWTPRYRFKNSWGMRGHAGGHFVKANIETIAETFLVLDFAAYAEYFLGESFYVDGGLGIQKWNSSTGGAFSTMGFGLGYQFDYRKVKIVDRLFVSYTSVGNEDKNTEIKAGIGLSF